MAQTLGSMISQLLSDFWGFTASTDQVTSLEEGIDASDTQFRVVDGTIIDRGIIEIDDEQIWVQSYDEVSGTVNVLPRGRGWAGTQAVDHDAGATVVIAPAYPRARIKQAIIDATRALWPSLWAVDTTTFTYDDDDQAAWEIPDDVETILDVRYKDDHDNWQRVRGWEVERSVDPDDFATEMALRITSYVPLHRKVQVVYGKQPADLVNDSDLFTSTGFEDRHADLVLLAAKARLLPMLDIGRLQVTHISADEMDSKKPLGSAMALAERFRAEYEKQLAREQAVLQNRYPARVHWTR